MNTITITNITPTSLTIVNDTPSKLNLARANFPPNAPLDFGSLETLFISVLSQSTPPSDPCSGAMYIDNGTNTAFGLPGFRRYTGSVWEDIGGAAGATLGELGDVDIASKVDNDRLVYNATSGKWENVNTIDGGEF